MLEYKRPEDYELFSPRGSYKAIVHFGQDHPSSVTSGYGSPYYSVEVSVYSVNDPNSIVFKWKNDSEKIQVAFSRNDKNIEILWEISGCIYSGSGTRYFRNVFKLPSGIEIFFASSDYSRNQETSSNPNQTKKKDSNWFPRFKPIPLLGGLILGITALGTGFYWILIIAVIFIGISFSISQR